MNTLILAVLATGAMIFDQGPLTEQQDIHPWGEVRIQAFTAKGPSVSFGVGGNDSATGTTAGRVIVEGLNVTLEDLVWTLPLKGSATRKLHGGPNFVPDYYTITVTIDDTIAWRLQNKTLALFDSEWGGLASSNMNPFILPSHPVTFNVTVDALSGESQGHTFEFDPLHGNYPLGWSYHVEDEPMHGWSTVTRFNSLMAGEGQQVMWAMYFGDEQEKVTILATTPVSFKTVPVPEPSAIVLTIMGLLSLMIRRF